MAPLHVPLRSGGRRILTERTHAELLSGAILLRCPGCCVHYRGPFEHWAISAITGYKLLGPLELMAIDICADIDTVARRSSHGASIRYGHLSTE